MQAMIEEQSVDPITQFFKKRVQRVPYLRGLSPELVTEMSFHLKLRQILFGQQILAPGEVLDQIMIIMKGCVEVYVNNSEEELIMDYLGPGSIIGQYSVLGSEEVLFGMRAKMVSGTTIMCLSKQTFEYLRMRHNEIDIALTCAQD